jgi:uracil-DNA glycosylase
MTWDDLDFWRSDDWDTVQRRLNGYDVLKKSYNPKRELLFAALDETPFDEVKVAWILQDPYPDRKYCTGVAAAVPNHVLKIPPTLSNIFREYMDDLHYTMPKKTDLTQWTSEGVLLWNAIPSCFTSSSGSHNWSEWKTLSTEIVKKLSDKGDVVFILSGRVPRAFVPLINDEDNSVIETSHPSPLSSGGFFGTRPFSKANILLKSVHGKEPINWEI